MNPGNCRDQLTSLWERQTFQGHGQFHKQKKVEGTDPEDWREIDNMCRTMAHYAPNTVSSYSFVFL